MFLEFGVPSWEWALRTRGSGVTDHISNVKSVESLNLNWWGPSWFYVAFFCLKLKKDSTFFTVFVYLPRTDAHVVTFSNGHFIEMDWRSYSLKKTHIWWKKWVFTFFRVQIEQTKRSSDWLGSEIFGFNTLDRQHYSDKSIHLCVSRSALESFSSGCSGPGSCLMVFSMCESVWWGMAHR